MCVVEKSSKNKIYVAERVGCLKYWFGEIEFSFAVIYRILTIISICESQFKQKHFDQLRFVLRK